MAVRRDLSRRGPRPCAGEVRVGIFAREDIPAGEEITYDYMFQSSGLAAAAAAYRCDRCRNI